MLCLASCWSLLNSIKYLDSKQSAFSVHELSLSLIPVSDFLEFQDTFSSLISIYLSLCFHHCKFQSESKWQLSIQQMFLEMEYSERSLGLFAKAAVAPTRLQISGRKRRRRVHWHETSTVILHVKAHVIQYSSPFPLLWETTQGCLDFGLNMQHIEISPLMFYYNLVVFWNNKNLDTHQTLQVWMGFFPCHSDLQQYDTLHYISTADNMLVTLHIVVYAIVTINVSISILSPACLPSYFISRFEVLLF